MKRSKNITGIHKSILNVKIKIRVLCHFIPCVVTGAISVKSFVAFLRRLLYFLKKMQHNKFVRLKGNARIDLYVPGYPSPAFYTACKKFMTFDEKLPCTTVLVSVTSACAYHCCHCYQKNDLGKDVEIAILVKTIKELQDMGIAFYNIEGGEPFLVFDRVKLVCDAIDERSEIWINSTGYGMSKEKMAQLPHITACMFSLHSYKPDEFNRFMGYKDAWSIMEHGISVCHALNIPVTFNTCLLKESFYDGTFQEIMKCAHNYNASIVQLIKPKPAGGWLESGADNFTPDDIRHVKNLVNTYNHSKEYKEYPSISAQIIEEDPEVFGCTAGGTDRFYINAKGDVQPCEFLNISFGNIAEDKFSTIYKKMRSYFETPKECWLCEKYSSKVVAIYKENHLTSLPLSPDLSRLVYNDWDRGKETDLYKTIQRIK
ncbi:MAG: radical SAM/SPASM domain-containing protein [bacterium]